MRKFSKSLLLFLVITMFFTSCKKETHNFDFSVDLLNTSDLIKEILEEIHQRYADNIAREKLEIGAINGMLQVLDEYSSYIPNDEFNLYNQSARGIFLGIGIEIKQIAEGLEIQSIIDESPAANAGLKHLDVITKINNKNIQNLTAKQISTKLGNDLAMKLNLTIVRNKKETFDVDIKKSIIQLRSVKTEFTNDIAVIKINYFNDSTIMEISKAIKKIHKKKSIGVIIDLRNNPGGILDQAIGVADLFLINKKIVEIKSHNSNEAKTIVSDDTDLLNNLPMAVLINHNTASGAELLASALGENKRAVIVGEKSYGKGTMQTIIPIPGHGAIKLTTAYFVSPNGNSINHKGIYPDIESKQQDDKDIVLLRALDLLRGIATLKNSDKSDIKS